MRALAPLALVATACAATQLAPAGSTGYRLEDDERTIWRLAAEEQARIERSGTVYEDPALEAYLAEVVRRIEPPGVLQAIPVRVRVVRNFRLNAFALPNGAVYLHSGIIARIESEAELATLLGHEITHASHRHAVRQMHNYSNDAGFLAAIAAPLAGLPYLVGGVGLLASVRGYSRELETEADEVGLSRIAAAGYDVAEAPKLFRRLQEWAAEEKIDEPFFFATHPRLEERVQTTERLVETTYASRRGGQRNAETFRRVTAGLVLEDARLQLATGRFGAAERDARKFLEIVPGSAAAEAFRGDVERQKRGADAAHAALAHYRRALDLEPNLAEAHRGIGLVLVKTGEVAEARAHLARYLELAPAAADRAYVEQYLARTGAAP
jgi:predicted Zn-dependent protease